MSMSERMDGLMRLLASGTSRKSLQWQVTADEDAFRLASAAGNVRIVRVEGFDRDAEETCVDRTLCVLNERGRTIEEYHPESAAERGLFDDLFVLARRSASNSDEVLDKLIGELQAKIKEDQPF